MEKIHQQKMISGLNKNDENQISGSPYLYKQFKSCLIIKTDHSEIRDMVLRFNIFRNVMEFKQKETILEIADPTLIRRIVFDSCVFIYAPYTAANKIRLSYFQLLTEGKYQLLKMYKVDYKESGNINDVGPVIDSKRFESRQPDYYLRYRSGMAYLLNSRKGLIRAIQPISQEVIDSIQQKKINVHNETELINTVIYINNSTN
ncbi:MAG: hypothetical protein Q8S54_12585 [Bacteroidota bacterium]|nr:hypothetical protein [Bacteroidota bacterium]